MNACSNPTQMLALQLQALRRLYLLAQDSCGGARVAAQVLLSLYNGNRFKVDLTDLRLLDSENFNAVLMVLALDHAPQMEVHQWLNQIFKRTDFGARFEHMAHDWRLQGRCRKDQLDPRPEPLGQTYWTHVKGRAAA